MGGIQRLHGADAEELLTVPGGLEVNVGSGQSGHIEDMGTARRRHLMARVEVAAQQPEDAIVGQLASQDVHCGLFRPEG